jgi:hypothetical protein
MVSCHLLLVARYWLLVAGCSLLVARYWLLVTGCSLLVARFPLLQQCLNPKPQGVEPDKAFSILGTLSHFSTVNLQ